MKGQPIRVCYQDPQPYPPGNSPDAEYWFATQGVPAIAGREYLPMTLTALFKDASFGKNKFKVADIQYYIDLKLDRNKKYFVVVQNDDGLFFDFSKHDLFVIGMSGVGADLNIPLVCQPHKHHFTVEKDILVSFVGNKTHPIRNEILKINKEGWYISSGHHPLPKFCEILARSKYVLCPRGYGKNSFRIAEALQYGAVPVYISDEFVEPYTDKNGFIGGDATDFLRYGIYVSPNDIENLEQIIDQQEYFRPQTPERLKWIYHTNYTFEAVKHHIINYMQNKRP